MYQQWEILDVSTSTLKVAEKCGEMTSIVRDMFVHYMIVIGVGNKVKGLEKAKVKIVVMNWRHENYEFEYGVLTMRVMETYMGQGSKGWDIGIKKGEKKHIDTLRVRYSATILSADYNETKNKNVQEIKKDAKVKKQDKGKIKK
ncbi:unnamed protein product [Cuscuta europaea]|uniref:Uncharacterized protein n=1 Tax=Cuscuta europaea TaxID=41803 RepID=A0A9P0Z8A7_CUSEU|nr:unnamed protein product [Cuscuta europaea]